MESPDLQDLLGVDGLEGYGEEQETAAADLLLVYVMSGGPKNLAVARGADRDAWWREVFKKLGLKASILFGYEELLSIKGRLGDAGERDGFPVGVFKLREGSTARAALQNAAFRVVKAQVGMVAGTAELEFCVCLRDAVESTPMFKDKEWREGEHDGKARNMLYADVKWDLKRINNEKMMQDLVDVKLKPIVQAYFRAADRDANGSAVVESARLLFDADRVQKQVLFVLSSDKDFGNLPGRMKLPNGAKDASGQKLLLFDTEVSFAFIGDRHRCFAGGVCMITNKHEPTVSCRADHNGCSKGWAVPRRSGGGGRGAAARRDDLRGRGTGSSGATGLRLSTDPGYQRGGKRQRGPDEDEAAAPAEEMVEG